MGFALNYPPTYVSLTYYIFGIGIVDTGGYFVLVLLFLDVQYSVLVGWFDQVTRLQPGRDRALKTVSLQTRLRTTMWVRPG